MTKRIQVVTLPGTLQALEHTSFESVEKVLRVSLYALTAFNITAFVTLGKSCPRDVLAHLNPNLGESSSFKQNHHKNKPGLIIHDRPFYAAAA